MATFTAGTTTTDFGPGYGYLSAAFAAHQGWSAAGSISDAATDFGTLEAIFYIPGAGFSAAVLSGVTTDPAKIEINSVSYDLLPSGEDSGFFVYAIDPTPTFSNAVVYNWEIPSGPKLIAEAGSYTLVGTSANLSASRRLDANPGSYTLSGGAATLSKGRTFQADAGAYSLNGSPANLIGARKLDAAAGSYALNGNSAGLFKGFGVFAEVGSYTFNGEPAELRIGRKLTANAGSYTLTGAAATLFRSVNLQADPGSYVLTGESVSIRYFKLQAEPGVYRLTGGEARLIPFFKDYKFRGGKSATASPMRQTGFASSRRSSFSSRR